MNLLSTIKTLVEAKSEDEFAVVQILSSLSGIDEKFKFQIVPLRATQRDLIHIRVSPQEKKTVSTSKIKILDTGEKSKMEELLSRVKDKGLNAAKWIKCKNCRQKFTQTIHKGKKSLPICPKCGTHNTDQILGLMESKRRHLDFKELSNKGIIFVTECFNLTTGEPCEGTQLITLYNIKHPTKEQKFISKALRHPAPQAIEWWQKHQDQLVQDKYEQILKSMVIFEKSLLY